MSYYKEHYATQKSMQRCVQCGKQDAYTLNGHPYCADCSEYRREYYKKRSKKPEVMAHAKEYQNARRKEFKDKGLCPICGRKSTPPYVCCKKCRAKYRAKAREAKKAYVFDDTVCKRCHNHPRLEGKKLCAECYEKMMLVQKAGAAARRERRKNVEVVNG